MYRLLMTAALFLHMGCLVKNYWDEKNNLMSGGLMFTYDQWYRIKEIGIKNSISRNDLNQLHMFVLELLSDIFLQFVITLKLFLK